MIKSKKGLLVALIIPIIALALLTGYKKYILSIGKEITLPITGYDPRDLLSGHYLIYTINYGVKKLCSGSPHRVKKPSYVCLHPKKFSNHWIDNCKIMIKGVCNRNRFEAGIERYYVPEKEAKKLENLIQSNSASIVLSITKNGEAQIKDLLINGVPWRNH